MDHPKERGKRENQDTEWSMERRGEEKSSKDKGRGKGKGEGKGKGKGKGIRDKQCPFTVVGEAVPCQQAGGARPCSDLQQSLEWQAGPESAAMQWRLHPQLSSKLPFAYLVGQGQCLPR